MVRYDFGAIAEVVDLDSHEDVIVITRDLSPSGCFVKTNLPFPPATEVRIRITHAGRDFAATGVVVSNTREGMGVQFSEVSPEDRALLQEWLNVAAKRSFYTDRSTDVRQDQVARLKNRLKRPSHKPSHEPCIAAPAALPTKPKASGWRPIIDELLASARKLITLGEDGLG